MDDADDWGDFDLSLFERMTDDDYAARNDMFTSWLRPRDMLFIEPSDEMLVGWA